MNHRSAYAISVKKADRTARQAYLRELKLAKRELRGKGKLDEMPGQEIDGEGYDALTPE